METGEQTALLDAYGCNALQGFLISKPLRAKDMTTWLTDGRTASIGDLVGAARSRQTGETEVHRRPS